MVDIHSHILPFVDDGSNSLEQSFEMLRMAELNGTKTVVLTPHSNLYPYDRNLAFEIESVFNAFKTKVEKENINIELCLGAEVFCNDNVIPLARDRQLLTINRSRFMLVEFDFGVDPRYICSTLSQLSSLGYVPIVAHPERYDCVKSRFRFALDFMNCGALLQVNKGSIVGDFGMSCRDTAFELMGHRLCQFVASDAHSAGVRNTNMDLAYDIVKDEFDDKMADKLFSINPNAVVHNGKLLISRPII